VVAELTAENLNLKRAWFEAPPALFQGGEKDFVRYGGKGSRAE